MTTSCSAVTSLSSAEILVQLQAWAARQSALMAQIEKLQDMMDAMPDCPFLAPMYDVWNAYTKLISEKVGDKSAWLEYFEQECSMGAKPMEVSWANPSGVGQISVMLDSLEALVKVLKG